MTTTTDERIGLGTVLGSMLRWQKAQADADRLTALFRDTAYFLLKLPGTRNDYGMHLYPGIDRTGNLEVFAISVCDDKPGSGMIESCITRCEVISMAGDPFTVINDQEALLRIECWQDNYPAWIRQEVDRTEQIFSAFYIPGDDFPDDSPWQSFFLALNPLPGEWALDLVVMTGTKQVYFEDTVRPVPPFRPYGKMSRESFYLLDICMEINGDGVL